MTKAKNICKSIGRANRSLSIFDFHDHLQPVDQCAAFQLIPVNNSDSQLCGTVTSCGITPSGGYDRSFGTLSAGFLVA